MARNKMYKRKIPKQQTAAAQVRAARAASSAPCRADLLSRQPAACWLTNEGTARPAAALCPASPCLQLASPLPYLCLPTAACRRRSPTRRRRWRPTRRQTRLCGPATRRRTRCEPFVERTIHVQLAWSRLLGTGACLLICCGRRLIATATFHRLHPASSAWRCQRRIIKFSPSNQVLLSPPLLPLQPLPTGRLLTAEDVTPALQGRQAELFWPDDGKW